VLLDQVHQGDKDPMSGVMQHLDLSDDEAAALVALLTRTITDDRYPLSPRIRALKAILAKLRPGPGANTAAEGVCAATSNSRQMTAQVKFNVYLYVLFWPIVPVAVMEMFGVVVA
jgi:nitrate reductase NapE component